MRRLVLVTCFLTVFVLPPANATLLAIDTATYNGPDYNSIWDDDNNGNSIERPDLVNDQNPRHKPFAWALSLIDDGGENTSQNWSLDSGVALVVRKAAPVPEPNTFALLCTSIGMISIGLWLKRR